MNLYTIDVMTHAGVPACMELRICRDVVEVWLARHCFGVLDRDRLRTWLADPSGVAVVDEVTLSPTPDHQVAISLGDRVGPWPLTPSVLTNLQRWI